MVTRRRRDSAPTAVGPAVTNEVRARGSQRPLASRRRSKKSQRPLLSARSHAVGHVHGGRHRRERRYESARSSLSVLPWTIWLAKKLELFGARRRLFRGSMRVLQLRARSRRPRNRRARPSPPVARLIARSRPRCAPHPTAPTYDGIQGARRGAVGASKRVGRAQCCAGTSILATIGATEPFVGRVRHGVGHHEQLHRHLEAAHHESRGVAPDARRSSRTPSASTRRITAVRDLQHGSRARRAVPRALCGHQRRDHDDGEPRFVQRTERLSGRDIGRGE